MLATLIHVLIILLAVVAQLVNWLTYRRTRVVARQIADPDEREHLLQVPYGRFISALVIFGGLCLMQVALQLGRLLAGAGVDVADLLWFIFVLFVAIPSLVLLSRRDRRDLLRSGRELAPDPS
jgi:hypothetical protein